MRTVSTMVLDLQMFDSEDVASVVDLDVDTTGERSSRSSGERCELVGKGKKAGKGKKKGNGKSQGMEEIQVGKGGKKKAIAKAEQVCPSVTFQRLQQPALPKGTAFNDDETQWFDHNQHRWWVKCEIDGIWQSSDNYLAKNWKRCKTCRRALECLERVIWNHATYDQTIWSKYEKIRDTNKRAWIMIVRRFDAVCPEAISGISRKRNTSDFNAVMVVEEFASMTGETRATKTKMMVFGEWLTESQKPQFGELTSVEAKKQWQEWMSDADIFKDKGPRGLDRVEIDIGCFGSKFTTTLHGRKITGDVKRLKKPDAATLSQEIAKLSMNHQTMGGVELQKFMRARPDLSGELSMLGNIEIDADVLQGILKGALGKKAEKAVQQELEDGACDSPETFNLKLNLAVDDFDPAKPSEQFLRGGSQSWDQEIAHAGEVRKWKRVAEQTVKATRHQAEVAHALITDARLSTHKAKVALELKILEKRFEAISLVCNRADKPLAEAQAALTAAQQLPVQVQFLTN